MSEILDEERSARQRQEAERGQARRKDKRRAKKVAAAEKRRIRNDLRDSQVRVSFAFWT